jgi:chromosome segregation ATPase
LRDIFIIQTKSLDEGLREAEANLSKANSRLSALGQALGASSSSADLQAALEARLAELSDASRDLRETRRRLQAWADCLLCSAS